MSLCDCECEEHVTTLLEELQTLREETKTVQKVLVDIRLLIQQFTIEKKQYWKDERVRNRERTF